MRYVLDTNVVLYLLGGRLAEHLPEGEHFVSVITEMELLSYPKLKEADEKIIRDLLTDLTIVGLTGEVKEKAIALRRAHSLKLPDAIIAATALSLTAELLSRDDRLSRIPKDEVVCRKPPLK